MDQLTSDKQIYNSWEFIDNPLTIPFLFYLMLLNVWASSAKHCLANLYLSNRQSPIEELHPKFFEPPGRVCLYLLMICWVGVEPELLFGVWCSPSVRKPCSRTSVYSLLAIHLRKTQKALGAGRCSSNNTVSKSWTDPKIAHSFVLKISLQLLPRQRSEKRRALFANHSIVIHSAPFLMARLDLFYPLTPYDSLCLMSITHGQTSLQWGLRLWSQVSCFDAQVLGGSAIFFLKCHYFWFTSNVNFCQNFCVIIRTVPVMPCWERTRQLSTWPLPQEGNT